MKFQLSLWVLFAVSFSFAAEDKKSQFEVVGNAADSSQAFVVDSIEYEIGDAFDDANASTPYERWMFNIANKLHIKSKPSVINKTLSFELGDTITIYQLKESERALRGQNYISDASISFYTDANGKNIVRVKTSDHWSTTLAPTLPFFEASSDASKFAWGLLIVERNLLGYGQTIGFNYSSGLVRDSKLFIYKNSHFLFKHNNLSLAASANSDGYNYIFNLSKGFATLSDKWSYSIDLNRNKKSRTVYKHPERVVPFVNLDTILTNVQLPQDAAQKLFQYTGIKSDTVNLNVGRRFGNKIQKIVGINYFYSLDRAGLPSRQVFSDVYNSDIESNWAISREYAKPFEYDEQSRVGLQFILNWITYVKVKNLNRVKYSEDIELGFSFTQGVFKNIEALNASSNDWYVNNRVVYKDIFDHEHLITVSVNNKFFFNDDSVKNGLFQSGLEYMWKPNSRVATYFKSQFDSYYEQSNHKQLYLDGFRGMAGVPSFYYAGSTRLFFKLEERFFLPKSFERGTVVPVITTFINGGNAYDAIDQVDLSELRYNVGIGLRLGMTKSTEGVVNHLDIAWPLNGPLKNDSWKSGFGPRVSFRSMISL
ncbi:MAG: hypothetical protein OCC49_14855 [Fibrobacterales bacterium]